jgi:hypothetical protein
LALKFWYANCTMAGMNIENPQQPQAPIEAQTGPDDIIDTAIDDNNAEKDKTQEKLSVDDIEGAEPSKEETEVNPADADLKRSE